MTFFGILKIGPLEPCGNEFQSTGSHRLTVCTGTDSCYYISAYTWGQKRNTFPQGSSGSIFKIPKNVISYEPTEPTFEWAKLFCDISLTLMYNQFYSHAKNKCDNLRAAFNGARIKSQSIVSRECAEFWRKQKNSTFNRKNFWLLELD